MSAKYLPYSGLHVISFYTHKFIQRSDSSTCANLFYKFNFNERTFEVIAINNVVLYSYLSEVRDPVPHWCNSRFATTCINFKLTIK